MAVAHDIVRVQADDTTDRLSEQQDQARADPGPERGSVRVKHPAQSGQTMVLSQGPGVRRGAVGVGQPRHAVGVHAPAQEWLGHAAGGVVFGVPGVEIGLGRRLRSASAVGEPGEEGSGLGELLAVFADRADTQGGVVRLGPQLAELVPVGEVP